MTDTPSTPDELDGFIEWWDEMIPTPSRPEIGLYPASSMTPRRIYYGPNARPVARAAWKAGAAHTAPLVDVLKSQVRAVIAITKAGGDLRLANLNDRLMVDRLQDTLAAIDGKEIPDA